MNRVSFVISSIISIFLLCQQGANAQMLSADDILCIARNEDAGYYYILGTEKGYAEMFEHYKSLYENPVASEANKIKAVQELCNCYKYGLGTVKDDVKAIECMNKVTVKAQHFLSGTEQQDRSIVLCCLGQIYELRGMYEDALDLYKKAADLNNAEGMYLYGDLLRLGLIPGKRDEKTGYTWIEKSAQNGYYQAPSIIGWLYFYGDVNWERNYEKAVPWLLESSKYDAESCFLIGKMYFYGLGLEQDYAQALKYLSKAHGGEANYLLAQCYALGLGTKKNGEKASYHWNQLVNDTSREALFCIGHSFYFGVVTKQDYNQAVKYLERSTENNYWPAMFLLSKCYRFGRGVEVNIKKADELLEKSKYGDYDALLVSKIISSYQ